MTNDLARAWEEGAEAQAAAYGMAKDVGPNPYLGKPEKVYWPMTHHPDFAELADSIREYMGKSRRDIHVLTQTKDPVLEDIVGEPPIMTPPQVTTLTVRQYARLGRYWYVALDGQGRWVAGPLHESETSSWYV